MNEYRDFSGRLTFEIFEIESKEYLILTNKIKEAFKLKEYSRLISGFDEIFQDFRLYNQIIGLEWDIWSGYIIVSKNKEGEPLVREIAKFIEKEKINLKKKYD